MSPLRWPTRWFRPGARHHIIDARGAVILMCERGRLPSHAPRQLRRAVAQANQHRLVPVVTSLAFGVFVGIGAGAFIPRGGNIPPGVPPPTPSGLGDALVVCLIVTAVAAPLALLVAGIFAKRRGIEALNACLAARLCSSCCYDLRNLDPADDGATICPECGAAWRLPSADR